jgi:hypothetical protein
MDGCSTHYNTGGTSLPSVSGAGTLLSSKEPTPGNTGTSVMVTAASQLHLMPETAPDLIAVLTPKAQALPADNTVDTASLSSSSPAALSPAFSQPQTPPLPTPPLTSVETPAGLLHIGLQLRWGILPAHAAPASQEQGGGDAGGDPSNSSHKHTLLADPKRLLGSGASAWVYEGRLNSQPVAVKLVPPDDTEDGAVQQEKQRLALQKEAALLSTLSHPGIVRVMGVTHGVAGDQPWAHVQVAAWSATQMAASDSAPTPALQPPYAVAFQMALGGTLADALHGSGPAVDSAGVAVDKDASSFISSDKDGVKQLSKMLPVGVALEVRRWKEMMHAYYTHSYLLAYLLFSFEHHPDSMPFCRHTCAFTCAFLLMPQVTAAVAEALAYLNDRGLAHRGEL